MTYVVDLTPRVEEALAGLSERGQHEIMETIAAVLLHPEAWPPYGVGAAWFRSRSWVLFTAYPDGIEVYDLGWAR